MEMYILSLMDLISEGFDFVWLSRKFQVSEPTTIRLVIFVGLIFRGVGSSGNFVGLYFHGIPTLVT